MKKEINKRLKNRLKKTGKSVYGLSKVLGVTSQAAEYIVKKKDLSKDYKRLTVIADYLDCEIEDII